MSDDSDRRNRRVGVARLVQTAGALQEILAVSADPVPWGEMVRFSASALLAGLAAYAVQGTSAAASAVIATLYFFYIDLHSPPRYRLLFALGAMAVLVVTVWFSAQLGAASARLAVLFVVATLAGSMAGTAPKFELVVRYAIVLLAMGSSLATASTFFMEDFAIGAVAAFVVAVSVGRLIRHEGGMPAYGEQWHDLFSSLRRPGWRYGLCYGAASAVALWLGVELDLTRPYWATLTVTFVMQPHLHANAIKAAQRVIGSFGGIVVMLLVHVTLPLPAGLWCALVLSTVLLPLANARNYALSTVANTIFVLAVLDIVAGSLDQLGSLVEDRMLETLIGAGLAIGASVLAMWLGRQGRPGR
ncbi:FUSC family protein [Kaustia mangrovi]|uniref:FUSC family protein n=1 Tax=Kaustia mangrovi TaxID=2593653 RepID=A0A7S8HE18_9HYPH|nr:FUSC family protein [Kaustia mangrovi]QPC45059.1 FUSC family protein [Kaustia mangrovi]